MQNGKAKFAVIVRMSNENVWFRGPQRFATQEEAREYAHDYYQQHPSVKECRVVPMPDEGGEPRG